MKDMDYNVGEFDVDTLFPTVSSLTADDLLRGIRFTFSDGNERIEQRAIEHFQTFIVDVYNRRIGWYGSSRNTFTDECRLNLV